MQKSLLSLLAAACLLFFACQRGQQNSQNQSAENSSSDAAAAETADFSKLCVAPPVKNLDVPKKTFVVQPAAAQILKTPSGTTIEIPAAAFVDKNGATVTLPVEVKYREFRTAGQIIASGIPMKAVGQDGQEGWMQTDGMFEIEGFEQKSGEEVFVAPDKKIKVTMRAEQQGKFDCWFFDEKIGNWVDIGDSEPQPALVSNETSRTDDLPAKSVGDGETTQKTPPPAKPVLMDKTKPSLNFRIDYEDFPELKAMKGMVLQYAGNDPTLDPAKNSWIFKHRWEKIELQPGKTANTYFLKLESDEKNYEIPVQPSLNAREYETALRDYAQQVADYKKQLAAERAREQKIQQAQAMQAQFVRTLDIGKFGIFNYDIFWKQEANVQLAANFKFEKPAADITDLDIQPDIFLIFNKGKMVVRFPAHDWKKFAFNPNFDDAKLIAVQPDGRVAGISAADFLKLKPEMLAARGQAFSFSMLDTGRKIEAAADLDGALAVLR